jgi:hypothetical protein
MGRNSDSPDSLNKGRIERMSVYQSAGLGWYAYLELAPAPAELDLRCWADRRPVQRRGKTEKSELLGDASREGLTGRSPPAARVMQKHDCMAQPSEAQCGDGARRSSTNDGYIGREIHETNGVWTRRPLLTRRD